MHEPPSNFAVGERVGGGEVHVGSELPHVGGGLRGHSSRDVEAVGHDLKFPLKNKKSHFYRIRKISLLPDCYPVRNLLLLFVHPNEREQDFYKR